MLGPLIGQTQLDARKQDPFDTVHVAHLPGVHSQAENAGVDLHGKVVTVQHIPELLQCLKCDVGFLVLLIVWLHV